jgi:hypothetical protein
MRQHENRQTVCFSGQTVLLSRQTVVLKTTSLVKVSVQFEGYSRLLDAGRPLVESAVTALRGNGGTFPSQAQMSDAKAVQERAEGAHTERVILHVRSLCRAECVLHPKPVRPGQNDTTRRASARLGECLRQETQPNRRGSLRNTNYLNTGRKGEL